MARTQLGPDDAAASIGPRGRIAAAKRNVPHIDHRPPKVYGVTDGSVAVGTVEVVDRHFVAIDTDGVIIGRYLDLKAAVRALPDGGAR